VADHGGIEDVSLEEWNATIGIDQTGVFLGMKTAAKALTASEHGSVINISSIYGTIGGFGHSPAYHAAKGAVRTLTKNVALHWADRGIRVNSVHPGFIDTPIIAGVRGTPAEQAILGMTPLGRLGQASEIAAGVAYLASDDASYVTGLELYIDGGWVAR
jgi:NAD(P)-dependent dehydrogenase (short-subunit alcohol dehydrogenase family)